MFVLKLADLRFLLRSGETLVGRSNYCSIVLQDTSVSRQHAAVVVTPQGVTIEDLGSENGTFVNGERIQAKQRLVPGDLIELGPVRLELDQIYRAEDVRHAAEETSRYRRADMADQEPPTSPGPALSSAGAPADRQSAEPPERVPPR
jgi:pSer/pThr/pTyr-binding forkhead associated (FHA) protein